MNDAQFLLLFVGLLAVPALLALAYRYRVLERIARNGRAVWHRFRLACSENPYEPKATLLQSRDGSITLARLKNGQLRSLKREPKGKAARKEWKRMKRDARSFATATLKSQLSPS